MAADVSKPEKTHERKKEKLVLGIKQYKDTQTVLLTISHTSITVSIRKKILYLRGITNYSRILTNSHLSTTATFLSQRTVHTLTLV